MEKESQLAYAEVDAILNMLETEAVEKIPLKVREFFKNEKDKKNIPKFIENYIDKDNIELMRETICLLTILDINYWCETEEEKQLILNKLEDNDRIKEEELRERYNPDNIFKNKVNENINSESVALIEYKERSIIKRVFDKIFRFLKRR